SHCRRSTNSRRKYPRCAMGPPNEVRPRWRKTRKIAPAESGTARLVPVGDGQRVRGEERDDLSALRRHDDFLLDARGGDAVRGGAIRLHREHHARLELHRIVKGVETRDDGPLVQAETQAVTEVEPEGRHLALEADLLRAGEALRDAVGAHARLDE